jgi:hypothetical protein
MDRITSDLLDKRHISQVQIDRLLARDVKPDALLETLTKIGAISLNALKRFVV